MIEIKPIGSYFKTDDEGYLVNPASLEKIDSGWKPAIDAVIQAYQQQFGDHLVSVYLRGSVAKGEAVLDLSDLDSFAYVNLSEDEIPDDWNKNVELDLEEKSPFVNGFELSADPLERLEKDMLILNQSVCLFGKEFAIRKLRPGSNMFNHVLNYDRKLVKFQEKLGLCDSEDSIKSACTWFMKNTLRAGFEITMTRSGRYTRDLYLCYKDFSEYYPDKEPLMREVLTLALNPTSDKKKIEEVMNAMAPFISEEAKKYSQ